jgi:hypothetical protein
MKTEDAERRGEERRREERRGEEKGRGNWKIMVGGVAIHQKTSFTVENAQII